MIQSASDTAYFWRLHNNLQVALRSYGSGQHVDEAYEDLESLAYCTENMRILDQCEALLSAKTRRGIPHDLCFPEMYSADRVDPAHDLALELARDEARIREKIAQTEASMAEAAAQIDRLQQALEESVAHITHFICHGDANLPEMNNLLVIPHHHR